MKRGTRVEYVGALCLMHRGKLGTVRGVDRKGWILVQFDGEHDKLKCADFSLRVIDEEKPGARAR